MTRKSLRRRSHGVRNAAAVLVLLMAAVAAVAYVGLRGNGDSSQMFGAGAQAPMFSLTEVNGSTFNLANYVGKSDVLLFFNEGLSCSPCLQQMVDIDRDYSTFSKMGVVVASITTDSASDMATWAANNGIANMAVLADSSLNVDQQYSTLYAGSMHPGMAPGHTFILVDKNGTIIWREDYGTYTMYVPMGSLLSSVRSAIS